MGRKQKYITEEEKDKALKERQMRYYWKNQEKINKKNKDRYHEKVNGAISSSLDVSSGSLSEPFILTKL
jgi:hypothetical protein